MRILILLTLVIATASTFARPSLAQSNEQPTVSDDGHLGLVGEFAYMRQLPTPPTTLYAVQATCIGDDGFQGMLYRGGLPGVGWDNTPAIKLLGNVSGGQVELNGENVKVTVETSQATVHFEKSDAANGTSTDLVLQKVNRRGKTLGLPAPKNSVVLFAGTTSDELKNERVTDEGYMQVGPETTKPYGGFYMHAEFRTPYLPKNKGQQRGNSGIYIQGRYEVQILDSFALETVIDGGGAIYLQRKPDLNMCLPPMTWQTYDIYFQPPTWDADGKKDKQATLSLIYNGVPVHYRNVITAKTGRGSPEGPEPRPILFQNHQNPVVFRNIWLVPMDSVTTPSSSPSRQVNSQPFASIKPHTAGDAFNAR